MAESLDLRHCGEQTNSIDLKDSSSEPSTEPTVVLARATIAVLVQPVRVSWPSLSKEELRFGWSLKVGAIVITGNREHPLDPRYFFACWHVIEDGTDNYDGQADKRYEYASSTRPSPPTRSLWPTASEILNLAQCQPLSRLPQRTIPGALLRTAKER